MGLHDFPAGWHKGGAVASEIWVDTSNFSGILDSDDYTVQSALESIDVFCGTTIPATYVPYLGAIDDLDMGAFAVYCEGFRVGPETPTTSTSHIEYENKSRQSWKIPFWKGAYRTPGGNAYGIGLQQDSIYLLPRGGNEISIYFHETNLSGNDRFEISHDVTGNDLVFTTNGKTDPRVYLDSLDLAISNLTTKPLLGTDSNGKVIESIVPALTSEPTGFSDPTAVTLSYDSTTRKVTLTGTWIAYWQGVEVTTLTDGWESDAHADTNGIWFLSYDGSTISWSQTAWTFEKLQIAYVYYGTTDKFGTRECHGLMPWQAHEEFHRTIGTYKESGGDLSNYVLASTTAGDRRPDISLCNVHDEDLHTSIPAVTNNTYTQYYLTSTETGNFNVDTSDIVPLSGNQPYWNELTGGAYQQTLMSVSNYMSVWLVAVPMMSDATSQKYRFIWVQGQSEGSLENQQALTTNDVDIGEFRDLTPEFVFIAKAIIRYIGGNWSITEVTALTGNSISQTGTTGNYLSSVSVDGVNITGDGTASNPLNLSTDLADLVPYTGATGAVNLGSQNLITTGDVTCDTLNYTTLNPAIDLSGRATTELDNLGTVAINTSLISDTHATDDLGSNDIRWNNGYFVNAYGDTFNSLSPDLLDDGGFDGSIGSTWDDDSSGTGTVTMASSQLTMISGASGPNTAEANETNPFTVIAGRKYKVILDLASSASAGGSFTLKIGGTAFLTIAPASSAGEYTGIATAGTTAECELFVPPSGVGGNTWVINSVSVQLIPATASAFGDLDVNGDLDVGGAFTVDSATFNTLTVDQDDASVPGVAFNVSCGDCTVGVQQAGSITFSTGNGGTQPAGPPVAINGGAGGDFDITLGDGGDGYNGGNGAKGGSSTWITGDGGVDASGSADGAGGDFTIQLGDKGGATGSPLDGRFIVEDGSANDLFVVGADGIGFNASTPIVKQTTSSQTPATFTANSSGISDDTATWGGYTVGDIVAILQAYGLIT